MRLRIDLAYDGSGFHGWARQPGLRTVQDDLERGLDTVLRTTGASLTVAGRTDTGVNARGQVAHVDVIAESVLAAAGRSQEPPLDWPWPPDRTADEPPALWLRYDGAPGRRGPVAVPGQ